MTDADLSAGERARRRAEYVAKVEADCEPYGGAVDLESRTTWAGLACQAHARRHAGLGLTDDQQEALRRYPVCPTLDGMVPAT